MKNQFYYKSCPSTRPNQNTLFGRRSPQRYKRYVPFKTLEEENYEFLKKFYYENKDRVLNENRENYIDYFDYDENYIQGEKIENESEMIKNQKKEENQNNRNEERDQNTGNNDQNEGFWEVKRKKGKPIDRRGVATNSAHESYGHRNNTERGKVNARPSKEDISLQNRFSLFGQEQYEVDNSQQRNKSSKAEHHKNFDRKNARKFEFNQPRTIDKSEYFYNVTETGDKKIKQNRRAIMNDFIKIANIQPEQIEERRNGTLLIKCNSKQQGDKIKNLTKIGDCDVQVTYDNKLNFVQGVVNSADLGEHDVEDLLVDFKNYGVTKIHRFTKKGRDGTIINTNSYLLTFDSTTLPEIVSCTWIRCPVRLYIPEPMRCYKCQHFGHTTKRCRKTWVTCPRCAEQHSKEENCNTQQLRCANCTGKHPTYSKRCPKFLEEKEILSLKVKEKISFQEARRMVNGRWQGQSYVDVLIGQKNHQQKNWQKEARPYRNEHEEYQMQRQYEREYSTHDGDHQGKMDFNRHKQLGHEFPQNVQNRERTTYEGGYHRNNYQQSKKYEEQETNGAANYNRENSQNNVYSKQTNNNEQHKVHPNKTVDPNNLINVQTSKNTSEVVEVENDHSYDPEFDLTPQRLTFNPVNNHSSEEPNFQAPRRLVDYPSDDSDQTNNKKRSNPSPHGENEPKKQNTKTSNKSVLNSETAESKKTFNNPPPKKQNTKDTMINKEPAQNTPQINEGNQLEKFNRLIENQDNAIQKSERTLSTSRYRKEKNQIKRGHSIEERKREDSNDEIRTKWANYRQSRKDKYDNDNKNPK